MAETTQDKKSLHAAFLALPPHIKEWLGSEQITYLIGEITTKLGLRGSKIIVIPDLIFRLAVQDLEPIDFINELSHDLGVSFPTAKSIAEDVEHRVLKPIETELRRDAGVDVKLIYFGKPSAQRAEPKLAAGAPLSGTEPPPAAAESGLPLSGPTPAKIEMERPAPPAIPLEAGRPGAAVAAPTPLGGQPLTGQPTEWEKLRKPAEPKEEAATPFILHQEGTIYPTDHKTAKVQNYFAEPPKKSPPKPVAVRLEYAQNNSEQTTPRVVHYNSMRTPLNNIGLPKASPSENRVDLRKFAKPDENTVDLRSTTNNKRLTTNDQ